MARMFITAGPPHKGCGEAVVVGRSGVDVRSTEIVSRGNTLRVGPGCVAVGNSKAGPRGWRYNLNNCMPDSARTSKMIPDEIFPLNVIFCPPCHTSNFGCIQNYDYRKL